MNRAFFIVMAPAVLVAAAYLAVNYGRVVPPWFAYSVAGACVVLLLARTIAHRRRAHGPTK